MTIKVTKVSPFSGEINTREIDTTQEKIDLYESGFGGLIQNIFPELSADDREFIMTGITPEEWDESFEGDDRSNDVAWPLRL